MGGICLVPMVHLSQSHDQPWNSKDTENEDEDAEKKAETQSKGKIRGLHQQSLRQ